MKKFLTLSILILLTFQFNRLLASHVTGSEITWTCIGQDSFLIKLDVYRDCNGIVLAAGPITFKCASTGATIVSVTATPGTPVDVTPVCRNGCTRCSSLSCAFPYGIHKYTMHNLVVLSNAGSCCQVKLSWEQCCRNAAITTGAGGENFFIEGILNRCQNPCDNSPLFTNVQVPVLCVGQDFTFQTGAVDFDTNSTGGKLDSLTYEWTSPLRASGDTIGYNGQYNFDKPIYFWGFPNAQLPFPRGIHLDSTNGDIRFRPMKAEVTVMTIKVKEYRNGNLIAEVRRDMQVFVITCTNNNPPSVFTPNNVRSKSVCAGDTVYFDFTTSDPNSSDTLTLSWDNAIQGAVWTSTNGQDKHPKAHLYWIPTDAHVSSLPYTFTVTAKDDACPVKGSFSQAYQITVKPRPEANIIVIDSGGGDFWFIAQRISGSGPVYMWEGDNFTFTPNTGAVVWHTFQRGIYPYTMTMVASGCSRTYYDTVIYDTLTNISDKTSYRPEFKIYPNPASDYVNIVYNGLLKWEGRLLLYDPNSKLVYNRQISFNQLNSAFTLPLQSFRSGMYLLKLQNASGTTQLKLLVQ
jgi:hypothetical protein